MTRDDALGTSIAGYRLVRKLAGGSRASVFLGAGTTGTVALKVFHADVAPESIGAELDALSRLDSPHFVRLLDVSSEPDETPILILDRVRQGSVVTLLRDRDSLEAGEVVTLLAPLAAVLPSLHSLGVGHQNISPATVHVGGAGEPVLLGFGHCALFAQDGSIAVIEAEPAAARDRDDLAALAITLLSRTRNAATDRRTVGLIEWIDSAPREFEFPERLEARLFDLADPVPVEFGRESKAGSAVPQRIRFSGAASPSTTTPAIEASPSEPADGMRGLLEALLAEHPLELMKARLVSLAKGVRKPFWIAAAGVVLAFVVVLIALPSSPPHPAVAAARPSPTPSARSAAPAAPALPDDPVLALPILLGQRTACITALSVLCLNDIDEASSSAYSQDAELIEQLQGGSEIPKTAIVTAPVPALVELLGASAIVSLGPKSNPASVLMIKDEAGWRIRGYLTGVPATGSPTNGGAGG